VPSWGIRILLLKFHPYRYSKMRMRYLEPLNWTD